MNLKSATFILLALCACGCSSAQAETAKESEDMVLRLVNGYWNDQDISVVDELVAENFVNYAPSNRFQGHHYTADELKAGRERFRQLMPDLNYEIEDVIAENGKVMVRATGRFRHTTRVPTRYFGEAAPSDNEVTYAIIFIYYVENGKIVKGWDLYDAMDRFNQLGVLPDP